MGAARKSEDALSAYYRFTSIAANNVAPDVSASRTPAFITGVTVDTTTACDEGPDHATLRDVVGGQLVVECRRGEAADTGCYHEEDGARDKQTVEAWFKAKGPSGEENAAGENAAGCRVMERWACGGAADGRAVLKDGASGAGVTGASLIWALDVNVKGSSKGSTLTFSSAAVANEEPVEPVVGTVEDEGALAPGEWFHAAITLTSTPDNSVSVEIFANSKKIASGTVKLPTLSLQATSAAPRAALDRFAFVLGRSAAALTDVRFWACRRTRGDIEEFKAEVLKQAEARRRKFTVNISSGGGGDGGASATRRPSAIMKLGVKPPGGGTAADKRRARTALAGGSPAQMIRRPDKRGDRDSLGSGGEGGENGNGDGDGKELGGEEKGTEGEKEQEQEKEKEVQEKEQEQLRASALEHPATPPPPPPVPAPVPAFPPAPAPAPVASARTKAAAVAPVPALVPALDASPFSRLVGSAAARALQAQPAPGAGSSFVVCGGGKTIVVDKDRRPSPSVLPIPGVLGWAGEKEPATGSQFLLSCSTAKMAVFEIASEKRVAEVPLSQPLSYGRHVGAGVFFVVNQVGGFLFGAGFGRPAVVFKKRAAENDLNGGVAHDDVLQVDVAADLNSAVVRTGEGWWFVKERGAAMARVEEWGEGGGEGGGGGGKGRFLGEDFFLYEEGRETLSAWRRKKPEGGGGGGEGWEKTAEKKLEGVRGGNVCVDAVAAGGAAGAAEGGGAADIYVAVAGDKGGAALVVTGGGGGTAIVQAGAFAVAGKGGVCVRTLGSGEGEGRAEIVGRTEEESRFWRVRFG